MSRRVSAISCGCLEFISNSEDLGQTTHCIDTRAQSWESDAFALRFLDSDYSNQNVKHVKHVKLATCPQMLHFIAA